MNLLSRSSKVSHRPSLARSLQRGAATSWPLRSTRRWAWANQRSGVRCPPITGHLGQGGDVVVVEELVEAGAEQVPGVVAQHQRHPRLHQQELAVSGVPAREAGARSLARAGQASGCRPGPGYLERPRVGGLRPGHGHQAGQRGLQGGGGLGPQSAERPDLEVAGALDRGVLPLRGRRLPPPGRGPGAAADGGRVGVGLLLDGGGLVTALQSCAPCPPSPHLLALHPAEEGAPGPGLQPRHRQLLVQRQQRPGVHQPVPRGARVRAGQLLLHLRHVPGQTCKRKRCLMMLEIECTILGDGAS